MTREEAAKAQRDYEEWMAKPIPRAKPKPQPIVALPVSERGAAEVKANPSALKACIIAAQDGTTIKERPRQAFVTVLDRWVPAVNAQGQPVYGDEPNEDFWAALRRPGDVIG